MTKKSEDLSVENVEEAIDNAIKKYFEKGLLIDGIFWGRAISLLKEKIRKEK